MIYNFAKRDQLWKVFSQKVLAWVISIFAVTMTVLSGANEEALLLSLITGVFSSLVSLALTTRYSIIDSSEADLSLMALDQELVAIIKGFAWGWVLIPGICMFVISEYASVMIPAHSIIGLLCAGFLTLNLRTNFKKLNS